MATVVTPHSLSQSHNSRRPVVKLVNVLTGSAQRSGGTRRHNLGGSDVDTSGVRVGLGVDLVLGLAGLVATLPAFGSLQACFFGVWFHCCGGCLVCGRAIDVWKI